MVLYQKKMTVIKDPYTNNEDYFPKYLINSVQIFFNQQLPFINAFLNENYKNQSVIGYDASQKGVLGIATSQGSGWLSGDSNALLQLSNGNFFMGFGDSYYGKILTDGLNSANISIDNIFIHNSFSYMRTDLKNNKIVSNTFYIGADQNKSRFAISNERLPDIIKNEMIYDLCSSIVYGQTYRIEWAPKGSTAILTPDLSNHINFEYLGIKATDGYLWPLAGMVLTNKGTDTIFWFTYTTIKIKTEEIYQTQIVKIPNAADSKSSALLINPFDWDSYSKIASLPNFMNAPIQDPITKMYNCTLIWTRAFHIRKYYYLMGYNNKNPSLIFLTRATDPNMYFIGIGIEAWTSEGWIKNTSRYDDLQLQAILFQNPDNSPCFITDIDFNQISEVYFHHNQYKLLFLDKKIIPGSLTIQYKIYSFQSTSVTGPYIKNEIPILEKLDPIFDTIDLYEMRAYPQLNSYVPQEYNNQKIEVVFSVVGQPLQTNGQLWYNCQSLFYTYKAQFFLYYSDN